MVNGSTLPFTLDMEYDPTWSLFFAAVNSLHAESRSTSASAAKNFIMPPR
jgi:hypothetical protein